MIQRIAEKKVRFKNGKCSIIHNGKYIFSPKEARTKGYVDETEEYYLISWKECFENNAPQIIIK